MYPHNFPWPGGLDLVDPPPDLSISHEPAVDTLDGGRQGRENSADSERTVTLPTGVEQNLSRALEKVDFWIMWTWKFYWVERILKWTLAKKVHLKNCNMKNDGLHLDLCGARA